MNIFSVAIGGAIGAMVRYLVGLVIMKRFPKPPFPIAMLLVNISGALGLGLFFGLTYQSIPEDAYQEPLFLIMGIGFFGAFTTFSTFSMETLELVRMKLYMKAVLYVGLSVLGSILFFVLGLWFETIF